MPVRPDFDRQIKEALDCFNALTPDEQAEIREAQRQSWVRGELAMGETRTMIPAVQTTVSHAETLRRALLKIITLADVSADGNTLEGKALLDISVVACQAIADTNPKPR